MEKTKTIFRSVNVSNWAYQKLLILKAEKTKEARKTIYMHDLIDELLKQKEKKVFHD